MISSGDRGLRRLLQGLLQDPGTPAAHKLAGTIFGSLEHKRRPSDEEVDLLSKHALLWARLGLGARGLTLLRRWRAAGLDADRAEAELRAAVELELPETLAAYRLAVERHPVPAHRERLARLGAPPDEAILVERTRAARAPLPLHRLWAPAVEALTADLHWNRVHGVLHLGGRGPFTPADRPILGKVLAALLATPSFDLPRGELFEAVWALPYDPLRHETKCHVTLHRLRAWLAEKAASPLTIITVQDGVVAIAEWMDVRVVEWS